MTAHKSWSKPPPSAPASSDPVREENVAARTDATVARLEARAAAREAQAREREAMRQSRRQADAALAESDPHRAAAARHRGSGRRDIVREQRDTSGYAIVVDVERIRALARRGAAPTSLAAVFGVPIDEIVRVLAQQD